MKKNRPGTLLSVLVPNECFDSATRVILAETSTFGVRYYDVDRIVLSREEKYHKNIFWKSSSKNRHI